MKSLNKKRIALGVPLRHAAFRSLFPFVSFLFYYFFFFFVGVRFWEVTALSSHLRLVYNEAIDRY